MQAAWTGGEDVITVGGQANHDGIAAAAAGQQRSRPAAMGHHDCRDTVRRPATPSADAGA
jgi:hypothetical protein